MLTVAHEGDTLSALVTGSWDRQDERRLRDHGIRRLIINRARGFGSDNVRFLRSVSDLIMDLEIVDQRLEDISPVEELTGLRRLILNTYHRTGADLSRLTSLEDAHLEWGPKSETVYECRSLSALSINGYPGRDLCELAALRKLRRVRVADSARLTSIECLSQLTDAESVSILGCSRLASIDPLAKAAETLRELEIYQCPKISEISAVGHARRLRRFLLVDCGRIASLTPLRGLTDLSEFYFYGSTNVADGDLSVLLELPALRSTGFADRAHYSLRRAYVIERLAERDVVAPNVARCES